jgi:hypothetical protein
MGSAADGVRSPRRDRGVHRAAGRRPPQEPEGNHQMLRTIGRVLAVIAFAVLMAFGAATGTAQAAGSIGYIGDAGYTRCFGAYSMDTGINHFIQVQRPIAYAFNQHPSSVDKQRLRSMATLYRWDGTTWKLAYTPAGVQIHTPWYSEIVSDGQDKAVQLSTYTPFLGTLTIPRAGYYAVLFDLRWDATNTVTVSGSTTMWATPIEENRANWLTTNGYCTYVPREITIDLGM